MARGVNKVILIGNAGADPEVRFTQSGAPVANLNLATTDTWNDRQSGQRQERTEWHRLVFFNGLAKIVGDYVVKGARLYVEGRLQTRKWQDQNGVDKYSTEIVANEINILSGGRQDNNQGASQPQGGNQGQYGAPGGQPQGGNQGQYGGPGGQPQGGNQGQYGGPGGQKQSPNNQAQQQGNATVPGGSGYDDWDDEIPFATFPNICGG